MSPFRPIITSSILVLILFVSFLPHTSAGETGRECIQIKEDFDLRKLAKEHNVLLIVHESGEDSSALRKLICNRLESTPAERFANKSDKRGRSTVFAYLEVTQSSYDSDGKFEDGGRTFARTLLNTKSFPSIIFLSGGMGGTSKYSEHISHYKGSILADGDAFDTADLDKFIHQHVGFQIGNDVYNIVFFDSIASKFVSYGNASGLDRIKQMGLALLVRFATLFSFKEPFNSIGKLYNRAFAMVLSNGVEYSSKQLKRLHQKIESQNLSGEKTHELNQKIAVLRSFAEPKELTVEENRKIFIHFLLHVGLLAATLLFFIIPSDSDNKQGHKDDGDAETEPIEAQIVDDEGEKGVK